MSKVKRSSSLLPSAIIIYLRLLAVLGGKARRDHTLLSRLKIFLWLSLASATAPPQKFALTHTFLLYFLSWLPTSRMIVILWSALWYNCSKNTKVRCLSWTLKLWDLLRRCKKTVCGNSPRKSNIQVSIWMFYMWMEWLILIWPYIVQYCENCASDFFSFSLWRYWNFWGKKNVLWHRAVASFATRYLIWKVMKGIGFLLLPLPSTLLREAASILSRIDSLILSHTNFTFIKNHIPSRITLKIADFIGIPSWFWFGIACSTNEGKQKSFPITGPSMS